MATRRTPMSPLFTSLEQEDEIIAAATNEDTLPKSLELDDQHSPMSLPKTASWQSVGLLMIADVVGAGVMSLATAFAELGWILSFLSLVFWFVTSMYVGMMILQAHLVYPECENFMQLSGAMFGPRVRVLVAVCVYSFIFFVLGDYVLILGETIEMMVYDGEQGSSDSHTCSHLLFSAFACLLLLPLAMIRLLGKTGAIMAVNMVSILASLIIAFIGAVVSGEERVEGENSYSRTEIVASSLTVFSFFHSQALFAFSFSGAFIYLEIIAEMRTPVEFRKSLLYFAGPFQLSVYFLAGSVGYLMFGSEARGLLIKLVPFGLCYQFSAFALAIHMMLTFLVKGTILSRAIHGMVSPGTSRDYSSWGAQRVFMGVAVGLIFGCFLVANLVPFFDDLTSLLGATNAPWIGYVLPLVFAVKARTTTRRTELGFMACITMFMLLLFLFGVASSFQNIVNKWETYGRPFSGCV